RAPRLRTGRERTRKIAIISAVAPLGWPRQTVCSPSLAAHRSLPRQRETNWTRRRFLAATAAASQAQKVDGQGDYTTSRGETLRLTIAAEAQRELAMASGRYRAGGRAPMQRACNG